MSTLNEKWLLVSCLQKSIRKGFENSACSYAGSLYELDKNYLIHKLGTILLEDIFLSDIQLINEFFVYANQKNHKKIDIINFIKKFSQSVKDRTAYDIIEITKIKNLKEYQSPEKVLNDKNAVIIDKFQSAKQILNDYHVKSPLSTDDYNIEKLLNEFDVSSNTLVVETIKNIYINNKDSNFLLLGFLEKSYQNEKNQVLGKFKTGDIIEYKTKEELVNNKWLLDGIDWHTKEGKSAIQDFLKEDTELKRYLVEINALSDYDIIIGLLLFKIIGQEVNKRLCYPTAVMAAKLSKKLEIEKIIGHKNFNQNELISLFNKDYPILKKLIKDKFIMPDPDSFPF